MVEQKRVRGWRRASRMILAGAAALALTVSSIAVFRAGSSSKSEPSTTSVSVSPTSLSKVPQFGNPDEARRYYDAKAKGDERALAVLDRALAEAELQGADAKYVEGLERERALRRERRLQPVNTLTGSARTAGSSSDLRR
jgi:hypothetical protein